MFVCLSSSDLHVCPRVWDFVRGLSECVLTSMNISKCFDDEGLKCVADSHQQHLHFHFTKTQSEKEKHFHVAFVFIAAVIFFILNKSFCAKAIFISLFVLLCFITRWMDVLVPSCWYLQRQQLFDGSSFFRFFVFTTPSMYVCVCCSSGCFIIVSCCDVE